MKAHLIDVLHTHTQYTHTAGHVGPMHYRILYLSLQQIPNRPYAQGVSIKPV